jgi:hypothetical protein
MKPGLRRTVAAVAAASVAVEVVRVVEEEADLAVVVAVEAAIRLPAPIESSSKQILIRMARASIDTMLRPSLFIVEDVNRRHPGGTRHCQQSNIFFGTMLTALRIVIMLVQEEEF